jgi:hypothetical protein
LYDKFLVAKLMKQFLSIVAFWILNLSLSAQNFSVSDSVVVSIITCSPGEEVYAQYGHTALRVNDPKSGLDLVFNYGIFDFGTPNFLGKFIKGATDYQLGVYEMANFLPEYAARNSMVTEQVLNFTPSEKKELVKALIENYQPENRFYRYNFVYDNCSIRPRDKVMYATNGFVQFNDVSESKTFRSWIGIYVGSDTWTKFGIDLIFGEEADRIATQKESMFLPELLMLELQSAKIVDKSGVKRNLISKRSQLLTKKECKKPDVKAISLPLTLSIIVFVIGILIIFLEKQIRYLRRTFDSTLLLITGLTGLIVGYLMFFSVHPLVQANYNLLWLNPLNLIVAIAIWFNRLRKYVFYYYILNVALIIAALVVSALSIQVFNDAAIPLMLLLVIRYSRRIFRAKKRKHKHRVTK